VLAMFVCTFGFFFWTRFDFHVFLRRYANWMLGSVRNDLWKSCEWE